MNSLRHGAVLLLVALCGVSFAGHGRKQAELTWVDSTYEIRYSFTSGCPRDTLYEVFHKPAHMRRYLTDANLEIIVHDSSSTSNDITYIYRYFISRLELRFMRRVEHDEHMVSFTLTSSASFGSAIIPKVQRVYGYYRVTNTESGRMVDYYQKTTLDRDLNSLYIFFIRRDTEQFLFDLEEYLTALEERLDSAGDGNTATNAESPGGHRRAVGTRAPALLESR